MCFGIKLFKKRQKYIAMFSCLDVLAEPFPKLSSRKFSIYSYRTTPVSAKQYFISVNDYSHVLYISGKWK